MKRKLLGLVLVGLSLTAPSYSQSTLYGLTASNSIFTMSDVNTPSTISGPYSISGVASGQTLVGLTTRSNNARLYALGWDSTSNTAQLYWLSNSGAAWTANAVGGTTTAMNLGSTNNVAFSFVASVNNQIRISGRNGNNYIMNADNGTVTSTGTSSFSYASGDLYSGSSNALGATAYTNNYFGSDATTQIGYDATNNVLVRFDSGTYANGFNNASYTLHSIGVSTGILFASNGSIGMDTWYDTTTHTHSLYLAGSTLLSGTHLYKYSLSGAASGTLTDMGSIGGGTTTVRAITFEQFRDSTSSLTGSLMAGLTLNLRNIVWFDAAHPQNIRRMVTLSGMTSGQNMIAIDYSPTTDVLYGLGYNSTAQTYQLYTINTTDGSVSAINSTAGTLTLGTDAGSGNNVNVGFRFIPTLSNRIRLIGNNGGTNVELNASTGLIASTDTSATYVTGDSYFGTTANLSSIAYTGYNGDTATQGFGYDVNTGALVTFDLDNSASGWGIGSSGYISSGLSLSGILSFITSGSTYNNAHMNIGYNTTTMSNVGYIAADYSGNAAAQSNYSVLYDMSGMLTAYHKTTTSSPSQVGTIGYGVPVKDLAISRTPMTTGVTTVANAATGINLYPNPVLSTTRITLPQASIGNALVQVIDLNGYVIRSFTYAPGSYALDVDMSQLPSGIYSIRLSGKGVPDANLKVVKVN